MKNAKTMKRALGVSVLAMVVCIALLAGTTMAWFTDSVSNGINEIEAGILDVELYHATFAEYFTSDFDTVKKQVKADTELFLNAQGKPILWEPGAEAHERFEIANEGNLALKFDFDVIFANATETFEGSGKTLADVLYITVVGMDCETGADNKLEDENLNNIFVLNNSSPINEYHSIKLEDFVLDGYLLPDESVEFEVLVKWIPTDVDNDYNQKADGGNKKETLKIDLGVTLLATQQVYEYDVNGNDYDEDAEYSELALPPITTDEDLQNALNEGGFFTLGADISTDTEFSVPAGKAAVIDLAGYDISTTGATNAIIVEGEVTFKNSSDEPSAIKVDANNYTGELVPALGVVDGGVINFEEGEVVVGGSALSNGIMADGGVINFNGGTLIVKGTGSSYGIFANYGATVNMNGGEIIVDAENSDEAYGIYNMFGGDIFGWVNVNLNAGKITVKTADCYGVAVCSGLAGVNLDIADGFEFNVVPGAYAYGSADGLGTLNVTGDNYSVFTTVSTPAEFADAVKNGEDVVLPAGTYTLPAEINGQTVTISGTADTKINVANGLDYINGADVTFEGVTIQSKPAGAGYENGFADAKYATFNNCVIDGTIGLDFSCEFNGCTFNISGNYYNVWTWGAGEVTFNDCTFNCDGKALLVYANVLDNGTNHQTVNINKCTFNDNGDNTVTGKAAIEITNTYTPIRTYEVNITETTVNGFSQTVPGAGDFNAAYGSVAGSDIGTNVWGNKCQLPNTQINVVIDGVDVY
ncbi:MAG: hypothetical protein E7672_02590 [Ruminococcaceae bacterium]|nr:hypothetical protein [Oscillospiraceae bacterium]